MKKRLTVKLAQVSLNESSLWNKLKSTSGTEERGGGSKCRIYFPDSEICDVSAITRVPKQTVTSVPAACGPTWLTCAHLCRVGPRGASQASLCSGQCSDGVFSQLSATRTHTLTYTPNVLPKFPSIHSREWNCRDEGKYSRLQTKSWPIMDR